jgi:hypothetical protein
MTSASAVASRFVRRTSLRDDEYRVNFKQIDCDVLDTLASDEACAVTPSMSRIYIRLIRSPLSFWEREGVLHFVGEEREGKSLTAWEQLNELTGVANSTLSKALNWMHDAGIIGYEARKNGVGIRIFINRALSSIRSTGNKKNLRLVPTPSVSSPAPSVGMPFKESHGREDLDQDINPRTHPRAAETPVSKVFLGSVSAHQFPSKTVPVESDTLAISSTQFNLAQVVGLVKRELEPAITSACDEAIATACRNEAALNREWFEKAGLPKAIRVAQHEAFNVLRSHGVIAKKAPNSASVGSYCATAEKGTEGKGEENQIATFLAEASTLIQQAAARDTALENVTLRNACLVTDAELGRLRDRLVSDERPDLQEIETKLEEIDRQFAETLWKATSAADLETMLRSARAELRGYEMRMEKEVFEQTVRKRVTASLRQMYGIPRVTLFYL